MLCLKSMHFLKIIGVFYALLEISKRKRCCSNGLVNVSFDDAKQRPIIGFVDKFFSGKRRDRHSLGQVCYPWQHQTSENNIARASSARR